MADKQDVPTEDLTLLPLGTFGKWRIVSFAGKQRTTWSSGSRTTTDMWNCECQCKHRTSLVIMKGNLIGKRTTQCRECAVDERRLPKRLYLNVWRNHRSEMCPAWKDSREFGRFYETRTAKFLVRRDALLPYSPENCLWSEHTQIGWEFIQRLSQRRADVRGESLDQALAWCDSVSHQRRYQWMDAHVSDDSLP